MKNFQFSIKFPLRTPLHSKYEFYKIRISLVVNYNSTQSKIDCSNKKVALE